MTRPRLRARAYFAGVVAFAVSMAVATTPPAPAPEPAGVWHTAGGALACCVSPQGWTFEWTPGHGWWHWVAPVATSPLRAAKPASAQSIARAATVSPTPLTAPVSEAL